MGDESDDSFHDLKHESKALQKYLQLRKSSSTPAALSLGNIPSSSAIDSLDLDGSAISEDSVGLNDFFPLQSAAKLYRLEADEDERSSSADIKSLRQLFRNSLSEKVDASTKIQALNAEIATLKATVSSLSLSFDQQKRLVHELHKQKLPVAVISILRLKLMSTKGKYFRRWTLQLLHQAIGSQQKMKCNIARKNILKSRMHVQSLVFLRWMKNTRSVVSELIEQQYDSMLEACTSERRCMKLTALRFKLWKNYAQKASKRRRHVFRLIRLRNRVTQRKAFWIWNLWMQAYVRHEMRIKQAAQKTASLRLTTALKHERCQWTTKHALLKLSTHCLNTHRNELTLKQCKFLLPCFKPFNKWRAYTILFKPTIPMGLHKLAAHVQQKSLSRLLRSWARWTKATLCLNHAQAQRALLTTTQAQRVITRWRSHTEKMRMRDQLQLPLHSAGLISRGLKLSLARSFSQWRLVACTESAAAKLQAEMINISADLTTSESVFTETRKQLKAERSRTLLLSSQVAETKAAFAAKFRRKNEYVLSALVRQRRKTAVILLLAWTLWRRHALTVSASNNRKLCILQLRLEAHVRLVLRWAYQKWRLKHVALGSSQVALVLLLRRVRNHRLRIAFEVFAQFIHHHRSRESRLLTASEKAQQMITWLHAILHKHQLQRSMSTWHGIAALQRSRQRAAARLTDSITAVLLRHGFSCWHGATRDSKQQRQATLQPLFRAWRKVVESLRLRNRVLAMSVRKVGLYAKRAAWQVWTAFAMKHRLSSVVMLRALNVCYATVCMHLQRAFRIWTRIVLVYHRQAAAAQKVRLEGAKRDLNIVHQKMTSLTASKQKLKTSFETLLKSSTKMESAAKSLHRQVRRVMSAIRSQRLLRACFYAWRHRRMRASMAATKLVTRRQKLAAVVVLISQQKERSSLHKAWVTWIAIVASFKASGHRLLVFLKYRCSVIKRRVVAAWRVRTLRRRQARVEVTGASKQAILVDAHRQELAQLASEQRAAVVALQRRVAAQRLVASLRRFLSHRQQQSLDRSFRTWLVVCFTRFRLVKASKGPWFQQWYIKVVLFKLLRSRRVQAIRNLLFAKRRSNLCKCLQRWKRKTADLTSISGRRTVLKRLLQKRKYPAGPASLLLWSFSHWRRQVERSPAALALAKILRRAHCRLLASALSHWSSEVKRWRASQRALIRCLVINRRNQMGHLKAAMWYWKLKAQRVVLRNAVAAAVVSQRTVERMAQSVFSHWLTCCKSGKMWVRLHGREVVSMARDSQLVISDLLFGGTTRRAHDLLQTAKENMLAYYGRQLGRDGLRREAEHEIEGGQEGEVEDRSADNITPTSIDDVDDVGVNVSEWHRYSQHRRNGDLENVTGMITSNESKFVLHSVDAMAQHRVICWVLDALAAVLPQEVVPSFYLRVAENYLVGMSYTDYLHGQARHRADRPRDGPTPGPLPSGPSSAGPSSAGLAFGPPHGPRSTGRRHAGTVAAAGEGGFGEGKREMDTATATSMAGSGIKATQAADTARYPREIRHLLMGEGIVGRCAASHHCHIYHQSIGGYSAREDLRSNQMRGGNQMSAGNRRSRGLFESHLAEFDGAIEDTSRTTLFTDRAHHPFSSAVLPIFGDSLDRSVVAVVQLTKQGVDPLGVFLAPGRPDRNAPDANTPTSTCNFYGVKMSSFREGYQHQHQHQHQFGHANGHAPVSMSDKDRAEDLMSLLKHIGLDPLIGVDTLVGMATVLAAIPSMLSAHSTLCAAVNDHTHWASQLLQRQREESGRRTRRLLFEAGCLREKCERALVEGGTVIEATAALQARVAHLEKSRGRIAGLAKKRSEDAQRLGEELAQARAEILTSTMALQDAEEKIRSYEQQVIDFDQFHVTMQTAALSLLENETDLEQLISHPPAAALPQRRFGRAAARAAPLPESDMEEDADCDEESNSYTSEADLYRGDGKVIDLDSGGEDYRGSTRFGQTSDEHTEDSEALKTFHRELESKIEMELLAAKARILLNSSVKH